MNIETVNNIEDMKKTMDDFYLKAKEDFDRHKGAIPKKKTVSTSDRFNKTIKSEKVVESEVESDCTISLSSDWSGHSSQTSSDDCDTKRKKKPQKKKKSRVSISKLLQSLDHRQIPRLTSFNEESGEDLNKYFDKFEEYCENNFKGNKDFWIGELESHLKGKALFSFESFRDYEDCYDDVKVKLLDWFKDYKSKRKEGARTKFRNAQLKSGETLFVFSSRLESLFKIAFPSHKPNHSTTLINQFLNSVPQNVREILRSKTMDYRLKKQKVEWKFIQKCVKIRDHESGLVKNEDSVKEEQFSKQKEITINLSNSGTLQNEISHEARFGNDSACSNDVDDDRNYRSRVYYSGNNGYKRKNNHGYYYNPSPYCTVCNKFGHISRNCQQLSNRLCFICNADDHLMRVCPMNYNNRVHYHTERRRQHHDYGQSRGNSGGVRFAATGTARRSYSAAGRGQFGGVAERGRHVGRRDNFVHSRGNDSHGFTPNYRSNSYSGGRYNSHDFTPNYRSNSYNGRCNDNYNSGCYYRRNGTSLNKNVHNGDNHRYNRHDYRGSIDGERNVIYNNNNHDINDNSKNKMNLN